jgi:hypothetical protein
LFLLERALLLLKVFHLAAHFHHYFYQWSQEIKYKFVNEKDQQNP